MTDKLRRLLARCKCGVYLTVNEHRDNYESAAEVIEDAESMECPPRIDPEVRRVMVETNTIVELHVYPDTPIGSYLIWHHSLDAALDIALATLGMHQASEEVAHVRV